MAVVAVAVVVVAVVMVVAAVAVAVALVKMRHLPRRLPRCGTSVPILTGSHDDYQ